MSERRPVPVPTFHVEPPREKRPWGWLALSVSIHAVLIGAAVWDFSNGPETFWDVDMRTPGGPGPAGGGGGGGGPRVTYVDITYYTPPRQREETPTPVEELVIPDPTIARVDVPIDTVRFVIPTDTTPIGALVLGEGPGTGGGPGAGTGTGGGVGSGRGTGVGPGTGPGTGGGGGEIFPPAPRYTILPPQPRPKSVQGRTYQAKITVAPDGRVVDVQIRPEIRDPDYRRRLVAQLFQWAFAPAMTREGTPVRGETIITLTL
jgi:protein TonB